MAEVGLVCRGQLSHLICLGVFRPRYVLDVEGIGEANKGECHIPVSPHCVLLGIEFPRNLADDKLGVAEHPDVADSNVLGEAESCYQCLIFGLIVTGIKQETESTFEIAALRGGENKASPTTFPAG